MKQIFLVIETSGYFIELNDQYFRTPVKIDVTQMNPDYVKRKLAQCGIEGYHFHEVQSDQNKSSTQQTQPNNDILNLTKQISNLQKAIENLARSKTTVEKIYVNNSNDKKEKEKEIKENEETFIPTIDISNSKIINKSAQDVGQVGSKDKSINSISEKLSEIKKKSQVTISQR